MKFPFHLHSRADSSFCAEDLYWMLRAKRHWQTSTRKNGWQP